MSKNNQQRWHHENENIEAKWRHGNGSGVEISESGGSENQHRNNGVTIGTLQWRGISAATAAWRRAAAWAAGGGISVGSVARQNGGGVGGGAKIAAAAKRRRQNQRQRSALRGNKHRWRRRGGIARRRSALWRRGNDIAGALSAPGAQQHRGSITGGGSIGAAATDNGGWRYQWRK
jgi:hypothetical protein